MKTRRVKVLKMEILEKSLTNQFSHAFVRFVSYLYRESIFFWIIFVFMNHKYVSKSGTVVWWVANISSVVLTLPSCLSVSPPMLTGIDPCNPV